MTSWYCNKCDRTINIKSKSRHFNSNSHKRKEKYSVLVKVYNIDNPHNKEVFSMFKNCTTDCHNKFFLRFTFKSLYDIEVTNGDFANGKKFDKKFRKIVRENGFIHKLTIKIYLSLSNINIRFYLKFRIPISHSHFFRIVYQNPDYSRNFCDDRNYPFHFACHKWRSENKS